MSKNSKNSVMVRIPRELKDRLERMAKEMLEIYETGRGCQDLELVEQGSKGTWCPLHEVIRKSCDEWEDKRARSNRSSKKKESV